MAFEKFQTIVGTAIVDPDFRRNLVERTEDTLLAFDLTPEESRVLADIQADTFEAFAQELHERLSTLFTPALTASN